MARFWPKTSFKVCKMYNSVWPYYVLILIPICDIEHNIHPPFHIKHASLPSPLLYYMPHNSTSFTVKLCWSFCRYTALYLSCVYQSFWSRNIYSCASIKLTKQRRNVTNNIHYINKGNNLCAYRTPRLITDFSLAVHMIFTYWTYCTNVYTFYSKYQHVLNHK